MLLLNCKSSFYIVDTSPLSDAWLVFFGKKFLILIKSNLPMFLPQTVLCVLYLQSHHQTQDHTDFSCMFSFRSFVVLHFVLSSFIHFELNFETISGPCLGLQFCVQMPSYSCFELSSCLCPRSNLHGLMNLFFFLSFCFKVQH